MSRDKPQKRHSLLLPVVLDEHIVPGSFAFALDCLADHELDLQHPAQQAADAVVAAGANV